MPALGTGGEPVNQSSNSASLRFSSNMDPQTGLSRALLLLLFLHVMLLGRSHPLGGPSPRPHLERSGAQVSGAGLHKGIGTGYWAAEVNRSPPTENQKMARLGARTLCPRGGFA